MSHETDKAFIEDYRWMLATGESHETAATRFGVSVNTLQRRVERVRLRVRESSISPAISGRIGDGAEELGLLDAEPTNTPESAKTPGANVADSHCTSLYRYFDENDILLYVGITSRGIKRNREHNDGKVWWPLVHRQTVEHFGTREEAQRAERAAIKLMRPPYNIQHNRDHIETRAMYEALRGSGLYGVNPLTIKERGRYLALDRVGPVTRSKTGRYLAEYASRLADTPIVTHIKLATHSVPVARCGRRSGAKVSVIDGRMIARLSATKDLPVLATAQFKYVTQKPIVFEIATIFGGVQA